MVFAGIGPSAAPVPVSTTADASFAGAAPSAAPRPVPPSRTPAVVVVAAASADVVVLEEAEPPEVSEVVKRDDLSDDPVDVVPELVLDVPSLPTRTIAPLVPHAVGLATLATSVTIPASARERIGATPQAREGGGAVSAAFAGTEGWNERLMGSESQMAAGAPNVGSRFLSMGAPSTRPHRSLTTLFRG
jgi:hypothetical protein